MNINLNIIEQAIIFATTAHSGAVRKGTDLPYIVHPLEALAIVAAMTDDPEILAAAVLHDVLEDTAVTIEQLTDTFGRRVAALVRADSEDKQKDKPPSDTWKQRKQETLDALKSEPDIAVKMIALADKLSNMRAISSEYGKIGEKVWDRFNAGKTEQAWYYTGLIESLASLEIYPAYQEFKELVDKVFMSKSDKNLLLNGEPLRPASIYERWDYENAAIIEGIKNDTDSNNEA